MGRPLQSIEEKFWRYIEPEPNSGCWLWSGSTGGLPPRWRYGKITHGKLSLSAHRVSWEIHKGQIPSDLCVCHKCDTTLCCNPEHLFLGTDADNAHDCCNKGRGNRNGVRNRHAKLTEAQIAAIRLDARSSYIVAADYGVTWGHINKIRSGLAWRGFNPQFTPEPA